MLKNFKMNNEQKELLNAFKSGEDDAVATAMVHFADSIQQKVLAEARQDMADASILSSRGQAQLTSEERKYYDAVIKGGGFDGTEELVPATIFERVFEDLTQDHGLLAKIQMVNVTGISEFIVSRGVNPAWWGKLTAAVKEVLDNGFNVVNLNQFKLSGYIPVAKSMLDLGPVWLDRYVRTVLVEALRIALEQAVVDGDGNEQPIGMLRDIKNVSEGKHSEKTAVPLKDFTPASLGNLMSTFSKVTYDGVDGTFYRNVKPEDVIFVCNPADYWGVVYPAITTQIMDGSYRTGLPLPFSIETSVAVPEGKAVCGVARDYFMGIGSTLQIGTSDEAKFIEDQRVYLAKQYANGAPKSNDSFVVLTLPKA